MRDIAELEQFVWSFQKDILKNIIKVNTEVAEQLRDNIRADAPVDTGSYRDSIVAGETSVNMSTVTTVSTSVYSAQTLGERGSTNPKWINVPLGALLEWGTGPEGASSGEAIEYGYSYRVDWHGMVARPHFKPNLYRIKPLYLKRLREAVKTAWKKRG